MELFGKIKEVLPLEQGKSRDGRPWSGRDFVVEDDTHRYGDSMVVHLTGELAEAFSLQPGQYVRLQFSSYARFYTDREGKRRYANDITCFSYEVVNR